MFPDPYFAGAPNAPAYQPVHVLPAPPRRAPWILIVCIAVAVIVVGGIVIAVTGGSGDANRTEIIDVVAVDSSGDPLPDWTAQSGVRTLDCSYAYPATSSVGTDIIGGCGGTADSANTCWIGSDRRSLTCAFDPWEKTYARVSSMQRLASFGRPDADPIPEWLELADGSRCRLRHGGSWGGRADDLRGFYGCEGTTQVVLAEYEGNPVDKSQPVWTVDVGELGEPSEDFPPPTKVAVTKAYFVASP